MHTSGESPVVCRRDLTEAIQPVGGFSILGELLVDRRVVRLSTPSSVTVLENRLATPVRSDTKAVLAKLEL